jgi:hypothetical protein
MIEPYLKYVQVKTKAIKPMEKRDSTPSLAQDEKERGSDVEHATPVLGKDGTQADRRLDISLELPGMLGVHKEDELDPVEAKRVKRKLDVRIIPLLMM